MADGGVRARKWPSIANQKQKTWNEPRIMKRMRISINTISIIALLALMAACATTTTITPEKANMLVAAGFKTVTPKTPAQQQKLQQLQTGQVVTIQKNGR